MTVGWGDEDRARVQAERLANEREWLEERRWCRCGAHARPGRSYEGEQTCERCGSPWRRPVVVKQERPEPKRVHYCHEAGGRNRRGEKCWLAARQGERCRAHPLAGRD